MSKPTGKYEVSALVDVRLTVYTYNDPGTKEEAIAAATKITQNLVSRFGSGQPYIVDMQARRVGSGDDFAPRPRKRTSFLDPSFLDDTVEMLDSGGLILGSKDD